MMDKPACCGRSYGQARRTRLAYIGTIRDRFTTSSAVPSPFERPASPFAGRRPATSKIKDPDAEGYGLID
jgi:hypothetical protein